MRSVRWITAGALSLGALNGSARADDTPEKVVEQLIHEDKRTELESLVNRLAGFTIEDQHVRRLMEAAGADRSDARRMYLWQAIRLSRSRAGRKYLEKALFDRGDVSARIKFVNSMTLVDLEDLSLLTTLYEKAESPVVRRAVIDLATTQSYDLMRSRRDLPRERLASARKELEATLGKLARWIVEHPANDDDLVHIVESFYNRAGTTHVAQGLLRKAWARGRTDALRVRLMEIASKRGARIVVLGLGADQSEGVKLASLRGVERLLRESRGVSDYQVREMIPTLSELANDPSPAVVKKVRGILGQLREGKVKALLEKIADLPRDVERIKERFDEPLDADERDAYRASFKRMEGRMPKHRERFARSVTAIEKVYGSLTEDEKASVDGAVERSIMELGKVLKQLKEIIEKPQ